MFRLDCILFFISGPPVQLWPYHGYINMAEPIYFFLNTINSSNYYESEDFITIRLEGDTMQMKVDKEGIIFNNR